MKILIAPDSFKGSLTAYEAALAMAEGARDACSSAEITLFPLADGGDGALDAWLSASPGRRIAYEIIGPRGEARNVELGIMEKGERIGQKTAVIEMALASGLLLVPSGERNPEDTTTYGTGQLLRKAVDLGAESIIVGLGGSVTNDGGAGALQALGVRFLNTDGIPLPHGITGGMLREIAAIDKSGIDFPSSVSVIIASDVDNPLTGPHGAAYVYAAQKGADADAIRALDNGLKHYAALIRRDLGVDIENSRGAGAAGGLGAGLMAFLNAEMRSGIDLLLDMGDFNEKAAQVDLVLTGEGAIDAQTLRGKVISGVLSRCLLSHGPPVIAIGGIVDESARSALLTGGLKDAVAACPPGMSREDSMRSAAQLLRKATAEIVRRFKVPHPVSAS